MCSMPSLPEVGCSTVVHITKVHLNPQTVIVQFGGSFNYGQETTEILEQLKDFEVSRKQQRTFEGEPGEVCLLLLNRSWNRARILSKSEKEYKVFLLDDGRLLWVSSKVLAKCPHNLCIVPPKVELCMLASIASLCLESAWSQAASKFIRSLCGKKISGCIKDVTMPSGIILLDIPSISKQMYELGFARKMPHEDFKSLVMHSLHLPRNPSVQKGLLTTNGQQEQTSDPDKLHQYLYPELLPGTIEIVTVTQVVHPLKIYCKLNVFSQELKKLSDQIHEYYEDAFSAHMPTPLSDGCPCATKGSDGRWYRSVLQQSNVSDVVKVFHVDYGIGDFVKLCNIRPLSERFFRLPVVTYACSLHGVFDKGVGWRMDQIDYLKSVVLDQILVGKFEHHCSNEGVYFVTLYGNDNVNLNDTFGHREQCLSVTERICGDQTLETLNKVTYRNVSVRLLQSTSLTRCSDSLEDVAVSRSSKTEESLLTAERRHKPNIAATPPLQKDAYIYSPPKIEVGAKVSVHITCIQSVSLFYGHVAQNTEMVRKIAKDIQQLCRKRPQVKFSIASKMMCLAKYTDGQWYRGQIESTKPMNKILVRFVDYGDLVVLDKSDIHPLPPQANAIASIPIQAVQFELFDVTLPEPCELNEWFKDYATDCMFTAIVKQNSSGKLAVEVYHDKTNLNLKIKDLWNKTKRKESVNGKGSTKTRTFKESSEGMECRGVRNFSTISQAHEQTKKVPKPVVQRALEQNFQSVTNSTTGHNRARPNVLKQQVTSHYPKLNDLPSRDLDAGHIFDIYVSHCNSPSSFFVQLTSDEDEIFSILDKLNSSQSSDGHVELNLLRPGDLVKAEYPADGAYYRAVVQNKRDGMIQVQFIDFGNEATLLPLKIKQLGKQFLSTPRLSIHCKLEDGRSIAKRDWTQEEIMMFKKAAGENGEKKIQCKFIREDASSWLVSLEHQGRPLFNVALKSGAQIESQKCCNEETRRLTFKEPPVTEGQFVEAYASSIVGPNYFWCQFKNSEELDKISRLAQEIGNCSQIKAIQPDQLCQGGLCLARFSDQLWYRAQVINTHDKKDSVVFIDYGNESEMDVNFVKVLPTTLLEWPPQAFLCQLDVFGSVEGTWTDAAADKFFELLVDEPLKVTIQTMVMSPELPMCPQYSVLVDCKGQNINDLMKGYRCDSKPQVAVAVKTKPTVGKDNLEVASCESVQKEATPKLASSARPSNHLNVDGSGYVVTEDHSIMCQTSAEENKSEVVSAQCLPQALDLPPRVIERGVVSKVYVSHINNLTSFFVQLTEDENELFTLTELLNSHQPSEKDEIHPLSIEEGSLVKALFPEDDSWYRAIVKNTTEDGMIHVQFIDFGNEATVPPLKIRRLNERLLSYPRFSIHCSCSLDDRFKTEKGTEEKIILFKKIFGEAGENTLTCKFIREDDATWEVKMTPSGGTSEVLIEKWDNLDLNALPVVSNPENETFQHLFKKPHMCLGETIEVFASCIVGPNYFWCQFSNSEILDQITLVAQEYGNSSETQPIPLENLDAGSLCLACFCDDQLWYRAKVIKKCTSTVSVLFIDFGNESEICKGSVKALPVDLLQNPPQAFLCRLEGFDPSEGSWESAAADNFCEHLVDKPLTVTVQRIDNTMDPNSPPYHVKVYSPQCLVNELMMKFWNNSTEHNQNSITSTYVDQSDSEDKTSLSLAISTVDKDISEPHCPEQHGGNQIEPLVLNDDLQGVLENKVDDELGVDLIAAITNSEVTANDPTRTSADLEINKICHESDDRDSVVSAEQIRPQIDESKDDMEDPRPQEDIPVTQSRSSTWVAGLENQMLPMVCTEDSCDSKCIFK